MRFSPLVLCAVICVPAGWTERLFAREAAASAAPQTQPDQVYWTFVGYSLMPKYEPTIETKEKMIIPVIDISSDPILTQVAQWLKEQK